jgi:hypothetical protein
MKGRPAGGLNYKLDRLGIGKGKAPVVARY